MGQGLEKGPAGCGNAAGDTVRDDAYTAAYLSRCTDTSPEFTHQSRALQRHEAHPCCEAIGCGSSGDLESASGKDRLDCREICNALSVTQSGDCCECWGEDGVEVSEGPMDLDVTQTRKDGEVVPRRSPTPLAVPREFKSGCRDWGNSSSALYAPSPAQTKRLQGAMKHFVRCMSRGVLARLQLDAEAGSGETVDICVLLTPDLTELVLASPDMERPIPVRTMRWVRPPERGSGSERRVVFRLAGGRVVCFEFEDWDKAGFFGMCMRLLVKASRSIPGSTGTPGSTGV